MDRLSVAAFIKNELVSCNEVEAPAEKIAKMRAQIDAGTVLSQSCDSLGQTSLATCKTGKLVTHYYKSSHSDRYMADCVKTGGTWSRNNSDDAELSRSKQELDKLQGKTP